jgi:hypothetical protein
VRKVKALSLLALGILVWTMVFAGCSGSSNTLSITLTPTSGQTLKPGGTVTITASVANDTNNAGVTWSLSGPGSLSGNTTTSVVYTAPATISVTTTATVTATSVTTSSITATESITLDAVLTITTTSLPAGTLGVPYNAFVNAAGATGTFTWAVISGSLPAGLTFLTTSTSSSAEITGTPTILGTSNFSVQVTDSSGASVTQALSITINRPPPLSVTTGSLPDGTVDAAYSQTLQANSGVQPYTWSITTGTLPVGLALASNGVISGTPLATGTSEFTVQVKDSSTPTAQIATANLSITINPGNTNNSRLSGNYAFSVRGFDQYGLFVAAGSFVADGNGNISAGILDVNNTAPGGLPVNQTFSGTYSIGQDGLGTISLSITTGGTGTRIFALSMMANGNANIIEFDDSTGGFTNNSARNSGVLLKQDTTAFSTSAISGSYAFGFLGVDSGKNRFGMAGEFQAAVVNGQGSITGGMLDSDSVSGASGSIAITGGAYSVASTGRGTTTITTQGTATYAFYVVSSSELLVIGIDPFAQGGSPLVSGTVLQQSSNGSFGTGSFNAPGVFEVNALDPSGSKAQSQVGLFTGDGGGTFTLTSDQNTAGALTSPCSGTSTQCGTGTYSVASNGRVTVADSGFQNSQPPQTAQPVLYLVSDNQAFIIGTDSAVTFGFMTPQSGAPFSSASLSGTYAGGSFPPVAQVNPPVSNVVSIAVAWSSTLTVTADISSASGLSQNQASQGIASVAPNGRVLVTENKNPTEVLYLVSPAQFFSLSTDASARVDIFGQ